MPQLSPWREFARKAAQALKRQLAQTEHGLSELLNPSRAPRAIPVPLPQRRAPRFPGDKRFYTQDALPKRVARKTASLATFGKTEFGRTLTRPRLTSGTSGTLRSHGYGRNFSSTPLNHAQVAREVYQSISQGLRAGILNTPFFPPPSHESRRGGKVMHGLRGHESISTVLSLPLCPTIVVPQVGTLDRSVVTEIDEALCSTPRFLAKLRRDLNKLMRFGSFTYTLTRDGTALQLTFHGKDRVQVERFLSDIGVTSGTLEEQQHGLWSRDAETVSWPDVFRAPRDQREESVLSLDRYVEAIDQYRFEGGAVMV